MTPCDTYKAARIFILCGFNGYDCIAVLGQCNGKDMNVRFCVRENRKKSRVIRNGSRNYDYVDSLTVPTMTQLRDMENAHHEKVSDIAVVTLEKLMKNELEEDLPDDLRMVCLSLYLRSHPRSEVD